MQLFIQHKQQLIRLKEKPFNLEKDIQNLFEYNLQSVLCLKLVKSEFKIKDNRIDTLAFDEENKAKFIVE